VFSGQVAALGTKYILAPIEGLSWTAYVGLEDIGRVEERLRRREIVARRGVC